MVEFIKENKIFAVIKSPSYEDSYNFATACIDGGIKIIEIISIAPGAKKLINDLSNINDVVVGAGTVLDLDVAKEAIDSGAKFIVSPHTDEEIIKYCKSKDITVIAGAFTSSEIVNAWKMGADFVKVFPASVFGTNYISSLKAPLPFIDIFVTGGISHENIRDYINSGASAVGISSSLIGSSKQINYFTVKKSAERFIDLLK